MSGLLRTPAPAGAGGVAPGLEGSTHTAAAVTTESLLMRLAAFSALGGFAAAHWGALVEHPPVGRTLLVLLAAMRPSASPDACCFRPAGASSSTASTVASPAFRTSIGPTTAPSRGSG